MTDLEYNQAELRFLSNGQIEIRMMVIKNLEEIRASKNQKELTLDEWYTLKALPMLRDCIDDLYSRGIKTMQMTDKGELVAQESGEQKSYSLLPDMPAPNEWPKLIELMKDDDIKATQENNELVLSWG